MNYWKKIVAAVATVPMLAAFVPTATAADVTPALAQATPAAAAADPQLLASWDFTGKDGTNSGSIADSTGKYNLTLNGGVSVGKFGDRSNNEALNLNNDANSAKYAQIDDQLFKDAGDSFTLEFAAKSRQADSDAFFTFAVGKDYNKYFFNRISTTKVKTVISDNKWSNEQGDNVDVANNNNTWHDYKIAVDGTNLAVWRDGTPIIFKANTGIKMSDLGGYTTYIGKSFYDGSGSGIGTDKYWNGAIDDIKVYKGASLTAPTGVAISGDGVVDGKLALTERSTAKLTATVTPDDAVSKDVTWTSSDDKIATVAADGTVTAVKQGTATITATAFGGVKAELPVTVNPMDPKSAATEDLDAAISALKKTTTENLPLVAEGTKHGSAITWTSSDPKLVTGTDADYKNTTTGADDPYKGAGVVTRPAYGDGDSKPVTLTATASLNGGEKVTKTVEVTVKEKTRTAPDTGYASVTFESDSNGGEKAWVASTEKNDFFTFKTRNNGQAVLTNDADTGGLRDMFVLRSHEGDKYYLIATDLKVSSMGWSQNQQYGSHKVEVYESTDMMNWTRTNGDGNGGITINSPNAGMTWAPEAYWDDDLNAYVVFFSSRMYTDDTRTTPVKNETTGRSSYAQVRYSITRDFVNFTEPQTWQDTGYSRIDSTVRKIGGYYYRLTKNEEGGAAGQYITTGKSVFLERSKVLTAPTTKADPNQDPNTGWQLLEQALLPFEGPETVKLNKDDELNTKDDDGYVLLSDNFSYRAFMTTGSELSKTTWDNPMTKRYPDFNNEKKPVKAEPGAQGYITQGAKGGLPDKVRHGAFVNVPQTVLDVTKTWTAANPTHIQAVDSAIKAAFDKDSRKLTATVTAADKGTLAGSVTFIAGDWTETAKLDAKGKATVTVPAEVKGDVTVIYDGYTDGLVNASAIKYNVQSGETGSAEDDLKAKKDLDALAIESADDIRGNFSVATKGANGSEITWKVTEGGDNATVGDGVNSKSATVAVKRPAAGKDAAKVTLTATVKNGTATLTKTFEVTVQPMPAEEDDQAYVWAFFTGEGQGAEKISLAASKGNDALDWNTLNNGQPLFTSEFGEKGLRDPFIIRSKDGDKFYMLATDLKIAGREGSFDTAQRNGSKYIEVWKSDDLVNWSKQSHVKVSSDYAGNTWAPEAYYDEEIGKYVVHWASNLYDTTDNSLTARPSVTYNRMIYVTTDDFVNFSDPQIWVNVNQGQGKGMIDATIAKQDGVYYRFYKDESQMKIREEKSTNLLSAIGSADKPGSLPKQTGLAASDQWTLVKENIGDGQNNQYGGKFSGGEGPSVFPANKGDVNGNKWYLFMDQPNYHGGPNHYIGFTTDDLSTGDVTAVKYKNLPTNADGGKPRHGTVVPVTRAQYQKVLEAYAKNVAVTSVDAVNVATNVGEAPKLPETVHLTHADGSEADVAVVWDEVKADSYAKTGTFAVKGVAQDDSRMPVEATVTVNGIDISGATVTVEPKEFTADGAAKEPKVTVTLADGTELKAGDDYTVAYTDNVEPGTATVTVTGAGKYSGTATATFEIKKADETKPTVNKADLQKLYDKVKGYQEADYQSGWAAFKAALDKAYGLLQSSDASQPDVDQALKDLQSAADNLVKKPATKPQPTKPATTANTGSAIAGVTALAALTLAAGVALTVWRKRRA